MFSEMGAMFLFSLSSACFEHFFLDVTGVLCLACICTVLHNENYDKEDSTANIQRHCNH